LIVKGNIFEKADLVNDPFRACSLGIDEERNRKNETKVMNASVRFAGRTNKPTIPLEQGTILTKRRTSSR